MEQQPEEGVRRPFVALLATLAGLNTSCFYHLETRKGQR